MAHFLDIFFPPSEEVRMVRALAQTKSITNFYAPQKFEQTTALMSFRSPTVRALIHEAKFHNNATAFKLLGTILHTHLTTHPFPTLTLIIPIPLSRKRERERGYNQVLKVIECAALDNTLFIVRPDILVRHAHTKPQTELPKTGRLTNVAKAFQVVDGSAVGGQTILLLDDVVTTGATLEAARAALLPYSPREIISLALAH